MANLDTFDGNTCLAGNLSNWPLTDILLWLHHTQRTSMLRIGTGLEAGVIFFSNGHLFRCEWGQLKGEQALIALLRVREGAFALIQRSIPSAVPNIRTPTAQLLLQCAVAQDEQQRIPASA